MTKKQFKQALAHVDWMLSLSNDFKEMGMVETAKDSKRSSNFIKMLAARKAVEKEINSIFTSIFPALASECRRNAIKDYKASTQKRLNEAKQNILETENYLVSLKSEAA